MLTEWMLSLGQHIIDVVFALTGVLPDFSSNITGAVDKVFILMFNGVSLVSIFIDMNMVKLLIPFVIAILNFDKIIKAIMFILKKIPILDIK